MATSTHTYARLPVSERTFREIEKKLRAAGYGHAFLKDGTIIDMNEIGIELDASDAQSCLVGTNSGHGHVWERPDGLLARCGGPALCKECANDQRLVETEGS